MEVHHHSHSPGRRKKWSHYFWEFLMLFLAVFCGFLAENQREHYVEHLREKQFMRSIVEDLRSDTAMIRKALEQIEDSREGMDSMLLLLTGTRLSTVSVRRSYYFTYPALNNLPVVFNDRTITQLKNAGNMRLIRNQKVNDSIIYYWSRIEVIKKAQDRHLVYRTKGREMETEIFDLADHFILTKGRIDNDSTQPGIIATDFTLYRKYANVISYCGVMLNSIESQIKDQNNLAIRLIQLIRKHYHLKQ